MTERTPRKTSTARQRFRAVVRQRGGLKPVADELGVSLAYVSMIANGRREPGRKIAKRIQYRFRIHVTAWPQWAFLAA